MAFEPLKPEATAQQIIDAERRAQAAKTARLKEARLAKEQADMLTLAAKAPPKRKRAKRWDPA